MRDDNKDHPQRTFFELRHGKKARSRLALHRRDDDDEDEEITVDPVLELLDLYANLMLMQERGRDYRNRLAALLRRYPDLQKQWNDFERAGGLTTKDLEDFLNGQFRPRLTRTRRHLRLISTRPPLRIRRDPIPKWRKKSAIYCPLFKRA
jgi:hypothetical protein